MGETNTTMDECLAKLCQILADILGLETAGIAMEKIVAALSKGLVASGLRLVEYRGVSRTPPDSQEGRA